MEENVNTNIIKKENNTKKHENFLKLIKLLIIAIIIEVFFCNYPAFRTLFSGNNNISANYTYEDRKITIKDIGVRVTGVNIIYEKQLTDNVIYQLTFIAEEDDREIELEEKPVFKNQEHYINFDTHSNCEEINIELKTGSVIKIKEILLNHPNFNISVFRIGLMFLAFWIIGKLKDKKNYKELYDPNSKEQRNEFLVVLTFLCLIIVFYTIFQQCKLSLFIKPDEIELTDATLMQTEAFMHGSLALLVEPSERLVEMEDPYNNSKKLDDYIPYLFDVAYYEGNYYSYFGIASIITLILPFRALTGVYMHSYLFNLVYLIAIIFLLYDVYEELVKKYIKKVSLFNFHLGYFAILLASNILITIRGAKYDIAMTSGIMFILLSISLAIRIGLNPKYRKLKFAGLGTSMALIVLSKPTYIVYYTLIVFFLWESIKNFDNKEKIKNIILTAIPLGVFAIIQMVYNYARFDNPFEFGAKYQLTTYNMQYCMSFSLTKIYTGIVEYIFRTPNIDPLRFPYMFLNEEIDNISMNEVCYENKLYGLIFIPILWIFIYVKNIIKNEDKDLKKFIRVCLITSLVAIIVTTCTGGICEEYSIDFKCILAIGAVILLLKNVENKQNSEESNKIFMILCISTILFLLPIALSTTDGWLRGETWKPISVFLRGLFEFWC